LPVLDGLARDHTVLVPDLLGHGASAKPRGDYSMGAFASGVRDLMVALDVPRATIVGHSLGGGVAMQLAYQFPERAERLALVSSGGLGRSVHRLLRAATLPGSELVLPVLAHSHLMSAGRLAGRALGRLGLRLGTDTAEMLRGHASLSDAETRSAFLHTLRASIDPGGQRVDGRDRLYLASTLPTMIIWGAQDPIIPVAHGRRAAELVPGSRMHVFEDAGHFPFMDDPDRFVALVRDWIAETEPASPTDEKFRALLIE
jgi:pimeloyl-ACP methyl ester carboxylesterase